MSNNLIRHRLYLNGSLTILLLMSERMIQGLIEQATSGELSKPDLNINKKICFAVREDDSL